MRPFQFWATALLVLSTLAAKADAQTANVSVALVVQGSPATVDAAAMLPASESGFSVGASLYVEVWARTDDSNGLSQVSADLSFDPSQLAAVSITHTAAFSLFANGTFNNATGLIDDLSGSVAPTGPPCSPQIGFPDWVRVAEVEMVVLAGGTGVVQPAASGSPIFVVAICGSFNGPQVEYLGVDLLTVNTAQVALVVQGAPATMDSAATLPVSESGFAVGTSLYVQVWARTNDPQGLSQVSTDLHFDPNQLAAINITHASSFSLFANGSLDNAVGLVDDLSGSVSPATPPCSTQVGSSDWARVAEVEMVVTGGGAGVLQPSASGSPVFVVALCGAFSTPPVEYLSADLDTLDNAHIELVSLASPSLSDRMPALPASQTEFIIGDVFVVEMWAQTTSGRGLSQVGADVRFDPSLSAVQAVTVSDTFSLLQSGTTDNVNGLLDNISGSVPAVVPSCSGQVGSLPSWARVATIDVTATGVGTQVFSSLDSAEPTLSVAVCDELLPPVSTYGSVAVTTACSPSNAPQADLIRGEVSAKSRFLSFSGTDLGASQAVRITFIDLPVPFDVWNGSQLWVGNTAQVSEAGAGASPIPGFPNFTAATLTCAGPVYLDLGALGVVHVFHEGIVPGGLYEIQFIDQTCDATDETLFSQPLVAATAIHGDILLDGSVIPPGPADGEITVSDIVGVLDRFGGLPRAPTKARAELVGPSGCVDLVISVTDIIQVLEGFEGAPYAFVPSAGDACASLCANVLP